MAHLRLVVSNKMKVIEGGQVHVHQRVFLVVQSAQIELAVESYEDPVVEPVGKRAGRECDVIGAFALGPGHWVGQRLKRDERLNTRATDNGSRSVPGVIVGKTEILDRCAANLGCWNPIKFVGAGRLIRVHETVDSVVFKIQIASDGVESKSRRIAKAPGNASQI